LLTGYYMPITFLCLLAIVTFLTCVYFRMRDVKIAGVSDHELEIAYSVHDEYIANHQFIERKPGVIGQRFTFLPGRRLHIKRSVSVCKQLKHPLNIQRASELVIAGEKTMHYLALVVSRQVRIKCGGNLVSSASMDTHVNKMCAAWVAENLGMLSLFEQQKVVVQSAQLAFIPSESELAAHSVRVLPEYRAAASYLSTDGTKLSFLFKIKSACRLLFTCRINELLDALINQRWNVVPELG